LKTQWLYYFSVLADKLNLVEASSSLNVSAATLQNNIKQLESHLSVGLFHPQYAGLTDAGQYFKAQALRMLVSLEQLDYYVQPGNPEEIKIAWSDFWGESLLPDLTALILDQDPFCKVNI